MNDTTLVYVHLLKQCMASMNSDDESIACELHPVMMEFPTTGYIEGINKKYLENELNWYKSQKLNIKGFKGIATNKIWNNVAADDGSINSNYGWCVYSSENGSQFNKCLNHLLLNKNSRHGIIIYTRPNIHDEYHDNIHAKYDMMCTNYTMFIVRDNKLDLHVHMRSNDIWYGLRYDLAWQQFVYRHMYESLKHERYDNLKLGKIFWICDSLHIYKRDLDKVSKYLEDLEKNK